ncbi:helix-turn-helix domain-containing protein [Aristophania vespae]|uniref:Helix-turn-helix domain-containing protein n=1 Tax=Aristophania vespae TaxID=2697033 RepID=A0A6P1NEL5_9PROT|nr:helix-turn-helix transcriptional regulator [Aristophania vespae]QHI94990.1 helix-turn-helix domain-containing protein [Aristophania vespae]UMM64159.1 hypothetical protein DM15PD_11510 [Aristophania vespae]
MSAPTSIDTHVGNRIRLIRILRGLTQGNLADALGITFQQIQKYERGANRVGASRLYEMSNVLDVPIGFFFDDLREPSVSLSMHEEQQPLRPTAKSKLLKKSEVVDEAKLFTSAETLELVRAYYRIENVSARRQVLALLQSLAVPITEERDHSRLKT